jgi:hypothetical protein
MFRKSPNSVPAPCLVFAYNNVLFLVHREGADCTSIGQGAGVSQSTIQSLNPGINCTFFLYALQEEQSLRVFLFCEQQAATGPSQPVILCVRDSTPPSARSTQPPRIRHAMVWLAKGTSARAILSNIMTMSTILVAILPSDSPYVVHQRGMSCRISSG